MAETLGNAASGQLLALLAIPLTGAILFAALIAVSLARRRKKTQMKLGTEPKKPQGKEPLTVEKKSNPTKNSFSSFFSAQESSAGPPARKAVSPGASGSSPAGPAGQSGQKNWSASSPANPSSAIEEENVDLATRLSYISPQAEAPSKRSPASEPAELLRLLRHPETGQLIVEVGGRQYTKLTDIDEKKVGQYIFKLAAHLLTFTNGMVATDTGLKSVYNPRVDKAPAPISVTSSPPPARPGPAPARSEPAPPKSVSPPQPSPEAEAALLASLRQPTPPKQPIQQKGLFGRSQTGPEPMLPALNLADEINKIVQSRLSVSPLADTTDLEITSDLSGGIRIRVNEKIYSGADEIPDPEVKRLIQAAIKEWERS